MHLFEALLDEVKCNLPIESAIAFDPVRLKHSLHYFNIHLVIIDD